MESAWQKRVVVDLPCPSGAICQVRRPSPEVSLRGGRLTHIFSRPTIADDQKIEDLSEDEADKIYSFARQMVLATVISPALSASEGNDRLTPEDIPPADFWFVFRWGMRGGRDIPVAMKEGETTVDAVETFPVESAAIDLSGVPGEQIQQTAV